MIKRPSQRRDYSWQQPPGIALYQPVRQSVRLAVCLSVCAGIGSSRTVLNLEDSLRTKMRLWFWSWPWPRRPLAWYWPWKCWPQTNPCCPFWRRLSIRDLSKWGTTRTDSRPAQYADVWTVNTGPQFCKIIYRRVLTELPLLSFEFLSHSISLITYFAIVLGGTK